MDTIFGIKNGYYTSRGESMKQGLRKDWKKILLWLIGIGIFTVVIYCYSEYEMNKYKVISRYKTSDSERLELSEPVYVEYDDVCTNDSDIKIKGDYKYSQIKVKNNSNDTAYQVYIELNQQETNKSPEYIAPSYYIDVLNPGETAVLSEVHKNIKENEKLELNHYSYNDGEGLLYTVRKIKEDDKIKFGIHSERNEKYYKYKNITGNIDALTVRYISKKIENGIIFYELEIKNESKNTMDNIYLLFNEYLKDNIVGNLEVRYTKKVRPKESANIIIASTEDINLGLVSYGYSKSRGSKEEKIISDYNVYINSGKYSVFEYENIEINSKQTIFMYVSNLIVLLILWILECIFKNIKNRGSIENKEKYIKKSKIISITRRILFIAYLIVLIYILIAN